MMERKLLDYWPRHLQELLEFRQIANAEQPEFERMYDASQQMVDDFFLSRLSEDGCRRWEKMLGLTPGVRDGLEVRRQRILMRFMAGVVYTIHTLREYLAEMGVLEACWVDYDAYRLHIRIILEALTLRGALQEELRQMIPANMELWMTAAIPQKVEGARLVAGAAMTGVNVHEHTVIGGVI
nr:MAG TPA: tail protein [Caudoviricetes sp.]